MPLNRMYGKPNRPGNRETARLLRRQAPVDARNTVKGKRPLHVKNRPRSTDQTNGDAVRRTADGP
jgi:hypothetical protein